MNLQDAITAGLFVRAAENPGGQGNQVVYTPPNGYTVATSIFANDLQTDISLPKDYLPFGFVARSPGPGTDFVVAIRGTDNIYEWIQDARFGKKEFPFLSGAGDTEDGFTDLYSSLRIAPDDSAQRVVDYLRGLLAGVPGATLTICGHSLGSAITTLLAIDAVGNQAFANPTVYTFASPNVGDGLFASKYESLVPNTSRIADVADIITHLPPRLLVGYVPVGQTFLVNPAGKVKMDVMCFHHLTTYLYLLSGMAGGAVIPPYPGCTP